MMVRVRKTKTVTMTPSPGQRGKRPSRNAVAGSSRVASVLRGIREAASLANEAEQAFRAVDPTAAELRSAAERAHCELLATICSITDEEANTVEPLFTKLESQLLQIDSLLLGISHFETGAR
jgi:hypothetical protein